jgi:hypothetical protein
MPMNLQYVAQALGGEVKSGQVSAPGPGHSPADRSLSVKIDAGAPDGFVVHSFANDDPITCKDHVRTKLGLPSFKTNGGSHQVQRSEDAIAKALAAAVNATPAKPNGAVVAAYDYTDDKGNLLYQVLRYEPKDFRQRRPDGNSGWSWKIDDRRVPYGLPNLLKYPEGTVFVCEGEKDADRVAMLGLCSTTVASGKWTDECVNALAGRDIILLEDNDDAGRKKAIDAAELLRDKAKTIRIVSPPGLADGGDVSDWLDNNSSEKLVDVCFDVPIWEPAESKAEPETEAGLGEWDAGNDGAIPPPRGWLLANTFCRTFLSVLLAPGGAGKTALRYLQVLSIATGRPLSGEHVFQLPRSHNFTGG